MENSGGSGGTLLHSGSFTSTLYSSTQGYSDPERVYISNIDTSKFYNTKLYSVIVIEFTATSADLLGSNSYFEIRLGNGNNNTSIRLENANDKASVVTHLNDNGSREYLQYMYEFSNSSNGYYIYLTVAEIGNVYSCFCYANRNSTITVAYSFKGYYPVTVP